MNNATDAFQCKCQSYLEGSECDGLLVVVIPGAPQLPGLVPHLLDEGVVLDDDRILHKAAGGVGLAVGLGVAAAGHPAPVQEDLEGGGDRAGAGGQVDTVGVTVEPLAEDHPVEGSVELDVDPDAGLLALDLDVLDLRQVRLCGWPDVIILKCRKFKLIMP